MARRSAALPPPESFLAFAARLGVRLTRAQRVLAMVAFDGAQPSSLAGADREVAFQLFGGRMAISPQARAVTVAVLGARSGKSYLAGLRLLHLAITVDLSSLAPGELATALIVAPDLRLARQVLRYVSGAVRAAMPSALESASADALMLRREDGRTVIVEALPASRGGASVRGRSLVGAVLDEAAFFLDENFVVADRAIFNAVTPRVVRGGQCLVISTPWSRGGLLFELFDEGFGRQGAGVLVAHGGTLLMRDGDPSIAAVVEREAARDPENAEREYGAAFTDLSSSLLASEDVDACRERGSTGRPRAPEVVYQCTLDVGLRRDRTCVMVTHVEAHLREGAPPSRRLVVDAVDLLVPKLLAPVTLDDVEAAVVRLASAYGVLQAHGDIHYSDAIGPRLRERGIKFVEMAMSPSAQETRAKTLAALFSDRAVRIPDHAVLIGELKDLRVERHAGGRVSVGAPGGSRRHDDAADALLLAAEAMAALPTCGGDAGRIEFRSKGRIFEPGQGVYHAKGSQWIEVLPDGRTVPAEYPRWAPGFAEFAEEQIAKGILSPNVLAYRDEKLAAASGQQPAPSRHIRIEE